ncbi:hypothetical protein ACIOG4_27610 [Streptomyces microflavus]|uniref:hypothetical protein n=1 Tax=Streptomyces microflavus TaxID=1919 RepID=UPI00380DED19
MPACTTPAHRPFWTVVQRRCNHSAFNGYRRTTSPYSRVECTAPGCSAAWRTKAAFVDRLPDAPRPGPARSRTPEPRTSSAHTTAMPSARHGDPTASGPGAPRTSPAPAPTTGRDTDTAGAGRPKEALLGPAIAPVPDLSDLTGMPEGPPPVADARGASIRGTARACATTWSPSRDGLRTPLHSAPARSRAPGWEIREWHSSFHGAVLSSLAAAEENAPEAERPWHADRLDAYAAAYGLRGWYRYRDFRGRHAVQVSRIRTHADGNRGRYYPAGNGPAGSAINSGLSAACVVDRDTNRVVYEAISRRIARQWIEAHESGEAATQRPPSDHSDPKREQ